MDISSCNNVPSINLRGPSDLSLTGLSLYGSRIVRAGEKPRVSNPGAAPT
jgi:hypothetical protein